MALNPNSPEARKRYLERQLRKFRRLYRVWQGPGFPLLRRKYAAAMAERYWDELKALRCR